MPTFLLSLTDPVPAECCGGALAIGNFDGVHLGHQALLTELQRQAQSVGGPAVGLTFDPHPLAILKPAQFQPLLTTPEYRAEVMQAYGAQHVVVVKTSTELLQLSADDFFQRVIHGGLNAKAMVEGFNFGFGRKREGTVDTLRALCERAGISLTLVSPVELDGRTVSSSRVRGELVKGDVKSATTLLGRPFRIRGTVGRGAERGRTLGFPTANLERIGTLIPAEGVYAVRVHYQNKAWPGAANIGPNPTFGEQAKKVEVHLIDFQGNLYGEALDVDFVERLRDTRPFASADDLVQQLKHDVEAVRSLVV